MITLPLLMFLGLPANVANGTNRVAILLQNVVGVAGFARRRALDVRGGILLAVPAVLGAVVGAQIAVNLDERMMRITIGILMVIFLILLLVRPRQWLEGRPELRQQRAGWFRWLIFFGIGAYGGFIQAGVGIFLLAGLVLGAGYDLVRANAVKVLIVLCFTPLALVVFLLNDQVRWGVGLILAVGNMAGAWVAANMAVQRGAKFVRYVLIGVIVIAATVFLGIAEFFQRLVL